MERIKNKIITISGEPASGKSTVVKNMQTQYEKLGFDVHVISVGKLFREFVVSEYSKIHPEKENVSLLEIQSDEEFMNGQGDIDKIIDKKVEEKGIEINSKERPNDVYIIDSRLAWKNIPSSYAVRLTVDSSIAGQRVYQDSTRGKEDSYLSLNEAINKTKNRKQNEIDRYMKKYNINIADVNNYNLLIDTENADISEISNIIIQGEKNYRENKLYPKFWASPTTFVPTQGIKENMERATCGLTIDEITESINKYGFSVDCGTVDVAEKDGMRVLFDGHHRCLATLQAGYTLVPYTIQDREVILDRSDISKVYDWGICIKYFANKAKLKEFENFSDNDLITAKKIREMSDTER